MAWTKCGARTFRRFLQHTRIISHARIVAAALVTLILAAAHLQAVVINEFQAWNWNTIADENGDYEDWLELYNPTFSPVYLTGYTLTDDPAIPKKWTFPAVSILGNTVLRVWASAKNRTVVGFPLHTNFPLENRGEFIGLYDPFGNLVDSVTYGQQYQDASYGRKPDGSPTWLFFATPTPNASNTTVGAPGFVADPATSPPAGIYSGSILVRLSSATPGAQIRYTLGGFDPTETSMLYSAPLLVTTPTVVRARAYAPPLFPSRVVTQTFLINVGTSMSLLSVVTDPANLWGPTGIYYADLTGDAGERPCSAEYWEERGVPGFRVTCGLRMHGGASQSRDDIHKKSFRLHFRRDRGPTDLEYPLLDSTPVDRFNKIVLRANYNDSWTHWSATQRANTIYIRDELSRVLRLEMGDVAVHGAQCMLFLNGHRWGIYNPCERIENEFLESYLDYPSWDLIGLENEVHEGDRIAWDSFYNWYSTTDLSVPGNYQTLQTMLDLENYTNYMVSNIWQRNTDWPQHNGYVARARGVPEAKWIFLDWDIEYGFGGGNQAGNVAFDMMPVATNTSVRISNLLSRLLQNANYRVYFAQRMDVLLNTAYDEPHIIQRMNEQAALMRPGIPYETMWARYWGETKTQADWEAALQRACNFINARTYYARLHVQQRLPEITGWMDVKVLPAVGGQGDVLLHAIRPPQYPWSGTFFRGIPLVLNAVPRPGYVFQGWSDGALPSTTPASLVLTAAHGTTYSIYARFAPEMSPPTITAVEFVARNRLAVAFSKPLEQTTAEAVANYTLDHGGGYPTTAILQTSPTIVLLQFADNLSSGTNYQISAVNVRPVIGNPIPSGSPATGNASFRIPPIAITEIMYNSIGPDVEWIELHNTTNSYLDISGWHLTDDDVYPSQAEGSWTLPSSTIIPPRGYVVVGIDDDLSGWNFPRDVSVVMPIVARRGNLKNSGDNLALFNAASGGILIDGSLNLPYPDLAVAGRSIEKIDDVFQWSANPLAWRQCPVPIDWTTALGTHATPGRGNDNPPSSPATRTWTLY